MGDIVISKGENEGLGTIQTAFLLVPDTELLVSSDVQFLLLES